MIEQTREIVETFNRIYKTDTLVLPKAVLPDNLVCKRIPGTDGNAKMGKSLGNCIYLKDSEEEVRKKIMSMYTDPNHIRVDNPGNVTNNTVFKYLDAFCCDEDFIKYLPEYKNLDELKAHYERGGVGDVLIKKFLNNIMQELLTPIRERRNFRYRVGGQIFLSALYNKVENISDQDVYYNQDKRALYDRWQKPGDVAKFKAISLNETTPMSSRFVADENTLSCESVSIGYETQDRWLRHFGASSMTIRGYMNDIFRISTVKNERGLDYPFARSVAFSLGIRF